MFHVQPHSFAHRCRLLSTFQNFNLSSHVGQFNLTEEGESPGAELKHKLMVQPHLITR